MRADKPHFTKKPLKGQTRFPTVESLVYTCKIKLAMQSMFTPSHTLFVVVSGKQWATYFMIMIDIIYSSIILLPPNLVKPHSRFHVLSCVFVMKTLIKHPCFNSPPFSYVACSRMVKQTKIIICLRIRTKRYHAVDCVRLNVYWSHGDYTRRHTYPTKHQPVSIAVSIKKRFQFLSNLASIFLEQVPTVFGAWHKSTEVIGRPHEEKQFEPHHDPSIKLCSRFL